MPFCHKGRNRRGDTAKEDRVGYSKTRVEEACRVKSMFSYLIFTSDKKLYDLQLKTELTILEEETLVPNHVLLSYSRAIVYQVYDRWIDIVFTHPSDHLKHVVKRQSNPFQILSVYVWEDLLFYTDLYYIWLCLPTLYDREPSKIKLAAVHPHGKEPVGAS